MNKGIILILKFALVWVDNDRKLLISKSNFPLTNYPLPPTPPYSQPPFHNSPSVKASTKSKFQKGIYKDEHLDKSYLVYTSEGSEIHFRTDQGTKSLSNGEIPMQLDFLTLSEKIFTKHTINCPSIRRVTISFWDSC